MDNDYPTVKDKSKNNWTKMFKLKFLKFCILKVKTLIDSNKTTLKYNKIEIKDGFQKFNCSLMTFNCR